MPRTGNFNNFYFDPEVFSDYMTEQSTWNDVILASGILVDDPTIMDLIGESGNVCTMPFYKPIDADFDEALNNDGETDNTPSTVGSGKQTVMLTQRMKSWKAKDFTKELTAADPMTHVANSVNNYYRQVWTKELLTITNAVLGVSGMAEHITDLTTSGSSVENINKIDASTLIYAQQKALGDKADNFGLLIINSMIYARYKELGLIDYNKYTITNAIERQIELPTIGGLIPLVTDRYTVDTSGNFPVYKSFIVGQGSFLHTEKKNYEDPYFIDYDPEDSAGIRKLYTKQGKVLHPNGISIKADNIEKESPTNAELGNSANWELKFNHKNVKIGVIKSNG